MYLPAPLNSTHKENTNKTETILTNQSSADSSKNTTSQNKSDDAAKGLSNLGDSLNERSKSSERVAQINADSANVQSLRNNIELLESQRMQLVLAKLSHIDNPAAAQVIDTEIEKIDIRLSERQNELSSIMTTPPRDSRAPMSARRLKDS
jgi:hypothetical protein